MRTCLFVTAALLLACDPGPGNGPGDGPRDAAADHELAIVPAHDEEHEDEPEDPLYWSSEPFDPLTAIDCAEHKDTGYVKGDPFEITVVTVDGKPVEVQTANAYYQMAQAAAADGVNIKVVSGFRTMDEQTYLYNCYINCNCNNCNLAAKPGYSNHQSGHALDLNTSATGVNAWIKAHGGDYGFSATVNGEPWHWEWWGDGPPASGPCGVAQFKATYVAQSFPVSADPAVELKMGETLDAWIDLKNTGKAKWTANTKLAPTPRDMASPLFDVGWLSPTRITGPDADTPAGEVGRFSFRLAANAAPGEYFQTFGLVEEGVTWFSQAPKGGGPPDDQLEVRIMVVEADPPPPPATTGAESGSSGGVEPGSTGAGEVDTGLAETGGASGAGTGSGGEGESTPTGEAGSGDMSGGTSSGGGWQGGAALPSGYGSDEGCGCRSPDGGPGRGGGAAPGLLVLCWLLRRRRRAA
ncbi:M15 family metallopeptidase [Nannocystis sp.]|uniref:M15 family metallopeptidase n=1 Tax=Nannocystis sp. TaxID=1962667 RepID=UPI0025DA1EDB|nr:M15 family metallopeptidase [Nannocystis sp.]